MNILNDRAAFLSNYEVFTFLKDIKEGKNGQTKPGMDLKNLATITYEMIKYLETSPCGNQTAVDVKGLMNKLKSFKLTKAEKLQVYTSIIFSIFH